MGIAARLEYTPSFPSPIQCRTSPPGEARGVPIGVVTLQGLRWGHGSLRPPRRWGVAAAEFSILEQLLNWLLLASMGQGAKWGSFQTIIQKLELKDSFGIPLDFQGHGRGSKHDFSRAWWAYSSTLGAKKLALAQSFHPKLPKGPRPRCLGRTGSVHGAPV